MKGITRHSGKAVLMLTDNINTDQIIPSREMKSVSKVGLADGLFANLRYLDASTGGRTPDPQFFLNKPTAKGASILIAKSNFGCGSSREHAVWALHEYGFRIIIATSYGSIFFDNCINNGILPIVLDQGTIAQLTDAVNADTELVVDLQHCHLSAEHLKIKFNLNEDKRQMLLEGSNAIDLTLKHKQAIDQFLVHDKTARPWVYDLSAANSNNPTTKLHHRTGQESQS